MISQITNNIYIGTIHDAISNPTKWDLIVCVAEQNNFSPEEWNDLTCQNRPFLHVPFMVYNTKDWFNDDTADIVQDCHADIKKLDFIADMLTASVNSFKESQQKILINCAAGVERSPLAVMWYLHRNHGDTLEQAYEFVKFKRPIVENRLAWLKRP